MQEENRQTFFKRIFKGKIFSITVTILGLIIIISLVIGGALLSSKKWDPNWNPFRQKINQGET